MKREGLIQSNKGFTLVEICVVFVLFSVLASITTMSLISWTEYSTQRQQDENAELIYMAARNKISKLRANNVLEEYKGWDRRKWQNGSVIAFFSADERKYTDSTMNKNIDLTDLCYAYCNLNSYETVSDLRKAVYKDKTKKDDAGTLLVFDLISSYINDKNTLKGSIAIEYSESTGVIYGVYYSDRCQLGYDGTTKEGYVNIKKDGLDEDILRNHMVGFYTSE